MLGSRPDGKISFGRREPAVTHNIGYNVRRFCTLRIVEPNFLTNLISN
jgi:hypothetical protein